MRGGDTPAASPGQAGARGEGDGPPLLDTSACPAVEPGRAQASRDADAAARIPLKAGLTLARIWTLRDVDIETLTQIQRVTADAITATNSGRGIRQGRPGDPVNSRRTVCRADLENGRTYWPSYRNTDPEVVRGSTLFSLPTVFRELNDPTRLPGALVEFGFIEALAAAGGGGFTASTDWGGAISRIATRPFSILVNGRQEELPAVWARGKVGPRAVEFFFLDDASNPLTLDLSMDDGAFRLKLVKISYPTDHDIRADLAERGRAEVYGIYFDFDSETLRPESGPVLAEIAAALAANPGWKLSVEGHTDTKGGDAYNLDLSKRRAGAVVRALVGQHGIAADRLSSLGHGASKPKAANDTVEGRALNRRVELVRQ